MNLKIVVPSYKRAKKILTKEHVSDLILCVPESQKEEYAYYNPETEITSHPDEIKGLPAKRNWMYNYFGELFMLDDDITAVQPMYKSDDTGGFKDKVKVRKIIENLYELSKILDIKLYGFDNLTRPVFFDEGKWYDLTKRVNGHCYGINKSKELYWDENLTVKEDIWISCLCKYHYRKILIDKRYYFRQANTFLSDGGLTEYRNLETEKESAQYLKKFFGDSIQIKKDNKHFKQKVKFNIKTNFQF